MASWAELVLTWCPKFAAGVYGAVRLQFFSSHFMVCNTRYLDNSKAPAALPIHSPLRPGIYSGCHANFNSNQQCEARQGEQPLPPHQKKLNRNKSKK
jgi:hypothetical protein